jgi:hypothetical protein
MNEADVTASTVPRSGGADAVVAAAEVLAGAGAVVTA